MKSESQRLVEKFEKGNLKLASGCLKFFGSSFGRPRDNIHTMVSVAYDEKEEVLVLNFDQSECLRVCQAEGIRADRHSFKISRAQKVRWEWFYYGRPQTKENLYYEEFIHEEGRILARTNADWHQKEFDVSPKEPAVEIC
ncbi:MAG: hypothetical protein JW893_04855 [Candidatus Omnitrophica bacterium]|nr:hypothetical protein [Candidatus Omnitrophota bacterium]